MMVAILQLKASKQFGYIVSFTVVIFTILKTTLKIMTEHFKDNDRLL